MSKCNICSAFISEDEIQCPGCGTYTDGEERKDERCECNNLLYKYTVTAVEIKCRRCKRIHQKMIKDLKDNKDSSLLEERCQCGNLLTKFTDKVIETKCRRCKRIHVKGIEQLT